MITCTLGDKKYTVDFISGRALREMEPAVQLAPEVEDDARDLACVDEFAAARLLPVPARLGHLPELPLQQVRGVDDSALSLHVGGRPHDAHGIHERPHARIGLLARHRGHDTQKTCHDTCEIFHASQYNKLEGRFCIPHDENAFLAKFQRQNAVRGPVVPVGDEEHAA